MPVMRCWRRMPAALSITTIGAIHQSSMWASAARISPTGKHRTITSAIRPRNINLEEPACASQQYTNFHIVSSTRSSYFALVTGVETGHPAEDSPSTITHEPIVKYTKLDFVRG